MAERKVTIVIAGDAAGANKAFGSVESGSSKLLKTVGGLGAAIGGAFAVDKIVDFGASCVTAFAESEQSQQKLADAFVRFPKLADTNKDALDKLNQSLALKTRFDDDATAAAEATLAQYGLTGKQLTALIPLTQDYAAKTGRDLPAAAEVLGKALQGKGKALADVGIKFVDTGSKAKNYDEIMGGLRQQVGGFAEKEGQTAQGKLAILQNQFGELQEKIGEKLLPVLLKLGDFLLTKVIPAIDKGVDVVSAWGPAIGKFAVAVKDVAVGAIQLLVNSMLGAAEWITKAAAGAFGWVPGLGGKLKAAAKAVEGFRDDVNRFLSGIRQWDPFESKGVIDTNLVALKEKYAPAVKAAGAKGGEDFMGAFAAQVEADKKAEAAAKKTAGNAAKAAKKTALDIFDELQSKVSQIFSSFDAMSSRSSAQRALLSAQEDYNEALARQAALPVQIAQAELALQRARRAAQVVTAAESNALLDAEDRRTQALQDRKDAQAAVDAAIKDGNTPADELLRLQRDLTRKTNDLAIAEEDLATARRNTTADTDDVADAEQNLKDLQEEQAKITDRVTEAREALDKATLDAAKAEAAYVDAQKQSSQITKEAIDQFKEYAKQAGISASAIDAWTAALGRFRSGAVGISVPSTVPGAYDSWFNQPGFYAPEVPAVDDMYHPFGPNGQYSQYQGAVQGLLDQVGPMFGPALDEYLAHNPSALFAPGALLGPSSSVIEVRDTRQGNSMSTRDLEDLLHKLEQATGTTIMVTR